MINRVISISKPSKRMYFSTKDIWKIESSVGLFIITTNKGVLSLTKCRQQNIGGQA